MYITSEYLKIFLTDVLPIEGSIATQGWGLLNEMCSMNVRIGNDDYVDIEKS